MKYNAEYYCVIDDNFHFSPSKLFPLGDEGILPYLSFFLRYVLQQTCQTPKGRDSEIRAGKSSEKWVDSSKHHDFSS